MNRSKIMWGLRAAAFALLFFFLFTGATMWLWNSLAVPIFGLPVLTFFQTVGLMILGRLLTGGFRGRGNWGRRGRGGMRQRWQNMPPEQREQFMQRWNKHGCAPANAPAPTPENPNPAA